VGTRYMCNASAFDGGFFLLLQASNILEWEATSIGAPIGAPPGLYPASERTLRRLPERKFYRGALEARLFTLVTP
jgi:hypothetical protein